MFTFIVVMKLVQPEAVTALGSCVASAAAKVVALAIQPWRSSEKGVEVGGGTGE